MKQVMKQVANILKQVWSRLVAIWSVVAKILGSIFLILIIVIITAISSQASHQEQYQPQTKVLQAKGEQQLAYVKLNGEIVQFADNSLMGYNPFLITPHRTRPLFRHLSQKQQVQAVVIEVNSPGGSVVASEEILQQIKQLAMVKPVIIYFGEVAASGGYYISAPATKIVANPASLTGSIGVIAFSPNLSGLYEKLGVEVNTYKTGQHKDMGSPNRAETEQEQQILQSVIDESYQLFLERIKQHRSVSTQQLEQAADGRILSSAQAKELGLIDQIGTLEQALRLAEAEAGVANLSVVEYQYGGSGFFNFLNSGAHSFDLLSLLGLFNQGLNQAQYQGQTQGQLRVNQRESQLPKTGIYYLWQ
jgi:protease-4